MNGKKTFKCKSNCFLSYMKNFASTSAKIQQDFENLFRWRCKLLFQCIIFLTRDKLEKLQMYLELLKIQCLWSFDERQKLFQIILLTNTWNFHRQREEEVNGICYLFFEKNGLPQCLRAADGTHVTIKRPSENSMDYINCKGRFSLNIQAAADHKYYFIEVSIKWPGCKHDAGIFSNSSITTKLRNGSIQKWEKAIAQSKPPVTVWILGDPFHPLLPFLMKEVSNGGKYQSDQFYGFWLLSSGMVIEYCFAVPKHAFIIGFPIKISKPEMLSRIYVECLKAINKPWTLYLTSKPDTCPSPVTMAKSKVKIVFAWLRSQRHSQTSPKTEIDTGKNDEFWLLWEIFKRYFKQNIIIDKIYQTKYYPYRQCSLDIFFADW